jgi:CheY-like chemotaxis protein
MEAFPLSPIPASTPIRDAVGFCLPLASISSVNIVTDLQAAKHAIVKSNALRLQQVLINMISNGIKYTERGSDIRIRIRTASLRDARRVVREALAHSEHEEEEDDDDDDEHSQVLVFSVSDCGSGIAPDQAERLFRRYARLDTQPKRTLGTNMVGQPSGTGLGLHLCQLFVERMNGEIWATNNSNNVGSSFSFYLPLISNEICNDSGGIPTALAAKQQRRSNSRKEFDNSGGGIAKQTKASVFDPCVLLVDDTLINRKVFDRMLRKIGISKSITVDSGYKALEALSDNHYDLVITDLQMPGMSGTELSVAIERSIEEPPVVIGLTADTSNGVAQRCAESGMADVLYKPITLAEMKEYFETTMPSLKPGIWYSKAAFNESSCHDADGESTPAQ